jgi:hypothetical protein
MKLKSGDGARSTTGGQGHGEPARGRRGSNERAGHGGSPEGDLLGYTHENSCVARSEDVIAED